MHLPSRRSSVVITDSDRIRVKRSIRPVCSVVESLETRQLMTAHALAAPASFLAAPVAEPAAVDAASPKVAFVQFAPLSGRVEVSITGDLAGINPAVLTNPANYLLTPIQLKDKLPVIDPSRPDAGVILAPNFVVTGVSLTPQIQAGAPEMLSVTINNNQPLRPGYYLFAINGSAIVDNAGNALDGAYTGVFPSGNGQAGSNFLAILSVVNNTVQPAIPVLPATVPTAGQTQPSAVFFPTTTHVQVKIVGNNNRKSRINGGGNARVVPLTGQFFPGTYHLPGTVGSASIKKASHSKLSSR